MARMLSTAALVASLATLAAPLPSANAAMVTAGRLCSLVQSNDPTHVVSQSPDHRTGSLQAGPYSVVTSDGPANPITLICLVQVNNPSPDIQSANVTAYSAPGVGAAVLPPTLVEFTATATDNIYVCSGMWFLLPGGIWVHLFEDFDAGQPGTQCELQVAAGI